MSRQLIEENMVRIEQICSSSYSCSQKEREMEGIYANFIEKYCDRKGGFITLPKSGIIKSYFSLKYILTKNEYIGFALNNLVFHRNEEIQTSLELIDRCICKKIIKEDEDWKQYCREDLQVLIDRSNNKKTRFVTGKSLFSELYYLLNSSINNYNLRNICIYRQLVPKEEFGKIPGKSEIYENLLGWIPIVKSMQIIMKIWAAYHYGYEYNKDYSHFDFLGVKKFPSNLGECIDMQERGHVDNYNNVANECNRKVSDNIINITITMDNYEYDSKSKVKICTTFLKKMSPGSLEEINYTGRFDNSRLIRLKVNEVLRDLNLI